MQPTRTRMVLNYHVLLDHPADSLVQIASRYRVTTRTVFNNVATVRAPGHRLPLPAPLITEATRASAPGDDHLGRVRTATMGSPRGRAGERTCTGGRGPGRAPDARPRLVAGARRGRPAGPAHA